VVHVSFQSSLCLKHNVVGALWRAAMLVEITTLNLLCQNVAVTAEVDRSDSLPELLIK